MEYFHFGAAWNKTGHPGGRYSCELTKEQLDALLVVLEAFANTE